MQRLPVGHTSHLIKHERDDVVLVKEKPGEIKNKTKANFGLARRDLFLMLNDIADTKNIKCEQTHDEKNR